MKEEGSGEEKREGGGRGRGKHPEGRSPLDSPKEEKERQLAYAQ